MKEKVLIWSRIYLWGVGRRNSQKCRKEKQKESAGKRLGDGRAERGDERLKKNHEKNEWRHKQACRRSFLKTKPAILRRIHHSFHRNLLLWRDGSNLVHYSHRWKKSLSGTSPKETTSRRLQRWLGWMQEIPVSRRKNLSLTETQSGGKKPTKIKILFYLEFLLAVLKHMGAECIRIYLPHRSWFFSRRLCCCRVLGLLGIRAQFRFRNR